MYPIVGFSEELAEEDEDELSFRRKATAALAILPLHIVSYALNIMWRRVMYLFSGELSIC